MAAWETLGAVGWAAVATNVVTLAVVVGLGIYVLILLRKVVANNLDQIAESLPKVIALIEASELDISVLIAVCEEKGTTAEELGAMYKDDQDRKMVVERRFGSKSRLTKRFVQWPGSQFMAKGYPAEQYLTEYLNKAENEKEK